MLVQIGDFYKVEHRARDEGVDRDQIKALRQRESRPILAVIGPRLEQWRTQVLPKRPIGQGIGLETISKR